MATNTSLEKSIEKVEDTLFQRTNELLPSFINVKEPKHTVKQAESIFRDGQSIDVQTRFSKVDRSPNRMPTPFENRLSESRPSSSTKEQFIMSSSVRKNSEIENTSPCELKVARTDVEVTKCVPKSLEKLSRSEVFKARVEIERAINIPPLLNEEKGYKILKKPSTFVSFTAFINNVKTELKTNVVHENCNPVWNSSWEVLLPLKLLYIADARLKFEVNSFVGQAASIDGVDQTGLVKVSSLEKHAGGIEHSLGPSGACRHPSSQAEQELRQYTVFIDVTVVSAGLPYINGWFSLIQYSRSCGQIKISITPLEDISKCKELWWKDNCKRKSSRDRKTSEPTNCQILTLNQNKASDVVNSGGKTETEKVSTDILAKSLQEKLKELECLTVKIKETFIGMSNTPAFIGDAKVLSLNKECLIQETVSEKKAQEKEAQSSGDHRDTLSDETLSKVMNISLNHEGSLLDQMLREDLGNLYPSNFLPYSEPQNTQSNVQPAENNTASNQKLASLGNEELLETASEEIDRIIRNIRYQHENT